MTQIAGPFPLEGKKNSELSAPPGGALQENDSITIRRGSASYAATLAMLQALIPPGQDGQDGVDGLTIRSGTGAPGAGLGVNGDFYIDTAAWSIYGPKTAGAWGSGTSLIGPGGGGGSGANLAVANVTGNSLQITSDSGTDATLPAATNSAAGLATAAQITKLEGVATGATANATDAQLRDRATHTGTQLASTISDFSTAADARITAQKGNASGLASLDGTGKLIAAQIPDSLVGAISYQGTWNASTNVRTPQGTGMPAAAAGNKGHYYIVSTAGTTTIDGVNDWGVTDWIVSNGVTWSKVDNTDAGGGDAASIRATSLLGLDTSTTTLPTSTDTILSAFGKLVGWAGTLAAQVRAVALTGLSTATSTVVSATDSVLVAIGKLQAQVSLKANAANPSLTGIVTTDGATVTTAFAMPALAIDVTKGLNTKSIAADSPFTFSATPSANTWFALHVTNTDTNPHTITFPSAFSQVTQSARTTCPIPASGQLYMLFRYDGAQYKVFGDGAFLNKFDATSAPGVGDDVADGYGAGSWWYNATANTLYVCESAAAGAAVWTGPLGAGGGGGTVTATAGALTNNLIVLGAGTTDTKVATGISSDGTSQLQLGVAGASVGSVQLRNATSGSITLQPTTGALGTRTVTFPAGDTQIPIAPQQITWAGMTAARTFTMPDEAASIGFRNVPQNSQAAAYTCVLSDAGKSIDHPAGDANARTYTIPANASVAYPIGTCLSFSNMTTEVVTIAITSDTMYLAGAGTTGSRSLARYGMATARKISATEWLINGTGLT